jgi:hypothetical protein
VGHEVLIYNSRLRLFPGKLKSRWFGPCVITKMFPHGALEIYSPQKNQTFKVNGHRVKPYIALTSTPREDDLAAQDLALQSVHYAAAPRALEPHLVDFRCPFLKE